MCANVSSKDSGRTCAAPAADAFLFTPVHVAGHASEKDLFLARAVFQYLAGGNLRDANIVFSEFVKARPPSSPAHAHTCIERRLSRLVESSLPSRSPAARVVKSSKF